MFWGVRSPYKPLYYNNTSYNNKNNKSGDFDSMNSIRDHEVAC